MYFILVLLKLFWKKTICKGMQSTCHFLRRWRDYLFLVTKLLRSGIVAGLREQGEPPYWSLRGYQGITGVYWENCSQHEQEDTYEWTVVEYRWHDIPLTWNANFRLHMFCNIWIYTGKDPRNGTKEKWNYFIYT